MDRFTPENYTDEKITGFNNISKYILETFRSEKYSTKEDYKYYHSNELKAFFDWCQGLPSLIDTCYYYNRSAITDVAKILEQSETEAARYTEEQAEQLLTNLIYKELLRGEKQ